MTAQEAIIQDKIDGFIGGEMDLLLIAMREMDTEIKAKRREWEKQGGREDQVDRSNYLDGFYHAWKIANRVHNKGAKNTEPQDPPKEAE